MGLPPIGAFCTKICDFRSMHNYFESNISETLALYFCHIFTDGLVSYDNVIFDDALFGFLRILMQWLMGYFIQECANFQSIRYLFFTKSSSRTKRRMTNAMLSGGHHSGITLVHATWIWIVIAKLQRISGIVSSCLVSSKEFQDKGNFCSANCYKCQVNTSKFYSLNFSNSVSAP